MRLVVHAKGTKVSEFQCEHEAVYIGSREGCGIQLKDGTILVVGGDHLGTSETYSPTTGTWVSPLKLSSPHYLGATASLSNGRAVVVGGFDVSSSDDKSRITSSAEIYSPGLE